MIQNAVIADPTGSGRVVDFHAHVVHPEVYALTVNHNVVSGFGMRPMEERPQPGSPRWPLFSRMTDPQVQIADMDTHGISHAVISTSTVSQSTYFAEAGLAAALDRQATGCNRRMGARPCRPVHRHFHAAGTEHQSKALTELEHAVHTLGLRIANLPASHNGYYLGSFRTSGRCGRRSRLTTSRSSSTLTGLRSPGSRIFRYGMPLVRASRRPEPWPL